MKTADQILRDALGILREHGWIRHRLGENGGPRCAVGALREASGFGYNRPSAADENYKPYYEARKRLQRVMGVTRIVDWNDRFGREFEQVEAAFQEAMKTTDLP